MKEILGFFAVIALLLFAVVAGVGRIATTASDAYTTGAAQRTAQVQIAESQATMRTQIAEQQETLRTQLEQTGETQRLLIQHETKRMLAQLRAQMGLTYFVLVLMPGYGLLIILVAHLMQRRSRETENRLDELSDSFRRYARRVEQRREVR